MGHKYLIFRLNRKRIYVCIYNCIYNCCSYSKGQINPPKEEEQLVSVIDEALLAEWLARAPRMLEGNGSIPHQGSDRPYLESDITGLDT